MRRHASGFCLVAASLSTSSAALAQGAAGTAFTYQGQLAHAGVPLTDTCDLRFTLWNGPSAGATIGDVQTLGAVTVVKGLFSVRLDFGAGALSGEARWLETSVRCASTGTGFSTLSPRQELTPAPYAAYALQAGSVVGNTVWSLAGNAGTDPRQNFLGTSDTQPLELHAGAMRALRLEPDPASPNLIGGFLGNNVTPGAHGAAIAGGGERDTFPPNPVRRTHDVTDHFGTIGGGVGNRAGNANATVNDAEAATVAGGQKNAATAAYASVGGGDANTASGPYATVPGGHSNAATGAHSFAAGRMAKAVHDGSFVWADSAGTEFASTRKDQFRVRAGGGVNLSGNSTLDGTLAVGNLTGATSTCCSVTVAAGCDDAACAQRVCAVDAFCCAGPPDGGWDAACVAVASAMCGSLCAYGDAAVRLPRDAVSATETLDEPGIAHGAVVSTVACTPLAPGTSVQVLTAKTITAPVSGYVLALATASVAVFHTTGVQTTALFGVSDDASQLPSDQEMYLSFSTLLPLGEYRQTVTVHGLFPVAAGARPFYFLAKPATDSAFRICDIQLTLVFFPTAYGEVVGAVAGNVSAQARGNVAGPPAGAELAAAEPCSSEVALLRAEVDSLRTTVERLKGRIDPTAPHSPAGGDTPDK